MFSLAEWKQSLTAERTRVPDAFRQRKFRRLHGSRWYGHCNVIRASASTDSGSESDMELLWRTGVSLDGDLPSLLLASRYAPPTSFTRERVFSVGSNADLDIPECICECNIDSAAARLPTSVRSWNIGIYYFARSTQALSVIFETLLQRSINFPQTATYRALPGHIRVLLLYYIGMFHYPRHSSTLLSAIITDVPLYSLRWTSRFYGAIVAIRYKHT